MLTLLLVVLLVLPIAGGWGFGRYGYASLSPAGLVLLVLLVLRLTGNPRLDL